MRQYFEEQLKEANPITKEMLNYIKEKKINYRPGDKVIWFLEMLAKSPDDISYEMRLCTEREIYELDQVFTFIEWRSRQGDPPIPCLAKKL